MRRRIYRLVMLAGCALAASTSAASAASGPQVEFGAVRAHAGTLYSVANNGGASSVSPIETAGWNTCTSGYSPVGK